MTPPDKIPRIVAVESQNTMSGGCRSWQDFSKKVVSDAISLDRRSRKSRFFGKVSPSNNLRFPGPRKGKSNPQRLATVLPVRTPAAGIPPMPGRFTPPHEPSQGDTPRTARRAAFQQCRATHRSPAIRWRCAVPTIPTLRVAPAWPAGGAGTTPAE